MSKKEFAAWITLDDGSRLAVTQGGSLVHLTDHRAATLAYATLAGEYIFTMRYYLFERPTMHPFKFFLYLWHAALDAPNLEDVWQYRWLREDLVPFFPLILAARARRRERRTHAIS